MLFFFLFDIFMLVEWLLGNIDVFFHVLRAIKSFKRVEGKGAFAELKGEKCQRIAGLQIYHFIFCFPIVSVVYRWHFKSHIKQLHEKCCKIPQEGPLLNFPQWTKISSVNLLVSLMFPLFSPVAHFPLKKIDLHFWRFWCII